MGSNGSFHPPWRSTPHRDFGEAACAIAGRIQRWRDSLAFDALGNITASAGRAGTGAVTYTNNRLTAWPGGFTYEFDADDNTTRRRKTTAPATDARFYWSPDGLLDSTVTSNGRRLTYEYNAFGQLARRRTNGTIDRHFAWDQDHLLIEMNGALTQRVYEYAWLPGTDQLLAVLCCETLVSAIYFAYQDVQGSLVGLISSAGSVFRRQTDSDAWGFVGVWGPTAVPAAIRTRWQGLMYEADSTQLYYVRARWYDPRTKRFMSPDPIGLSGGINPYAFAGNDPVNLGDPSGMIVVCSNYTTTVSSLSGHRTDSYRTCVDLDGGGGNYRPGDRGGIPWGSGGGVGDTTFCGYACAKVGGPPRPEPSPEGVEALAACAAEYGYSLGIGPALVAAGQPIPGTKRFVTSGSSGGTSIASSLSRKIPGKLPVRQWAPTSIRPYAFTNKIGALLGRWTPFIGWGIALEDAVAVGQCATTYLQLRK